MRERILKKVLELMEMKKLNNAESKQWLKEFKELLGELYE